MIVCLLHATGWTDGGKRILVLQASGSPPPEAFLGALRVHVGSLAAIEAGPALSSTSVPDRLAEAAQLARGRGAILVVWLQYVPAPPAEQVDVVVYAVGQKPGWALIEVARLPGVDRPEDHRVLALKVGNLLDLILAEAASPTPLETAFARGPTPPALPSDAARDDRPVSPSDATGRESRASAESPPRGNRRVFMETGAVAALGSGDVGAQAGLRTALGLAVRRRAWLVQALAVVRWAGTIEAANHAGALRIGEIGAAVAMRGSIQWARLSAGLDLELAGRFLHAEGRAGDGRTDSLFRLVPAVRAGAAGRVAITEHIALRALGGLELALVRQRFSIVRAPVADLGRVRLIAEFSLVVFIP